MERIQVIVCIFFFNIYLALSSQCQSDFIQEHLLTMTEVIPGLTLSELFSPNKQAFLDNLGFSEAEYEAASIAAQVYINDQYGFDFLTVADSGDGSKTLSDGSVIFFPLYVPVPFVAQQTGLIFESKPKCGYYYEGAFLAIILSETNYGGEYAVNGATTAQVSELMGVIYYINDEKTIVGKTTDVQRPVNEDGWAAIKYPVEYEDDDGQTIQGYAYEMLKLVDTTEGASVDVILSMTFDTTVA